MNDTHSSDIDTAERGGALNPEVIGMLRERELSRARGRVIGANTDRPRWMSDSTEEAWVVIANVSGGDWDKQSADWRAAAIRWRDTHLHGNDQRGAETEPIEATPLVKGGQGRDDCSPAMAILVLSACIALVAFVVIVLLSHPI